MLARARKTLYFTIYYLLMAGALTHICIMGLLGGRAFYIMTNCLGKNNKLGELKVILEGFGLLEPFCSFAALRYRERQVPMWHYK